MEMFHISDVISLLGLPGPPHGRSSYYIQCPCCDGLPRSKHLNINLKKDVYRCPRCGVSGGIFDLYSLYTGVPRDKAFYELPLMKRKILEMLFVEEIKPEEIAKKLNCSSQYVYNQKFRAIKTLREQLCKGDNTDE